MQINVSVQDANNIVCEVTPPQPEIIVIDRGVEGNGIVSIVPVTISTFQYLRITYTNGTVQDVGPLTSTAYTATAPITIVGNTISLSTVPIASGGTDATTAAGAIQNLLPSYTGNANKRLGLNSGGTALEWVADGGGTVTSVSGTGSVNGLTLTGTVTSSGSLTLGGTLSNVANSALTNSAITINGTSTSLGGSINVGTVTSVAASGGTTGLTFTGSPITTSGTLTLGGTLAIANGGTGQTTANAAFNALAPSQTGNSGKYLTTDGTDTSWATNPLGTVTSVAMTVPTGLDISGSPITTSGTLALTMASGYAIPTTASQTNWDTAYSERQQWSGTATNLVASTGRTSLGATTLGSNLFTITNPSAITFPRFNADNTVSALDAATFRTAIGAGTSSTTGTVTSVSGTGTVNGLTLTGTVTTSGSLTLGGTLNLSSPPAIGNTTPSTGNFTTLTENSIAVVTQSDIGTAANEIPLNQYLGSLAYQNGDAYYNTGMTVGFRNRIINGAMTIDQRNSGASVTYSSGAVVYLVDRWYGQGANSAGVFTLQQSSDAPAGFTNSVKATVTTSSTPSGTEVYRFIQRLEGYSTADFNLGTTNATSFTLSFWVKSSVIGTFSGSFWGAGATRWFIFSYTINSANTWEQKTVVVPAVTTGTFQTTNSTSLQLTFNLGAGSGVLGNVGSWISNAASPEYYGAIGQTNLISTNGATFYITGVQLEKGNIATSFDVRPYGTEFQLCQRYFEKSIADGTAATAITNPSPTLISAAFTTTAARVQVFFKTPKRATPTLVTIPSATVGTGNQWGWYNGTWNTGGTTVAQNNANAFSVDITGTYTAFQSVLIDGNWYASAEL